MSEYNMEEFYAHAKKIQVASQLEIDKKVIARWQECVTETVKQGDPIKSISCQCDVEPISQAALNQCSSGKYRVIVGHMGFRNFLQIDQVHLRSFELNSKAAEKHPLMFNFEGGKEKHPLE